jgi:hypothetical protein
VQRIVAEKHGLLPIYASLSPSQTLPDLAVSIVVKAIFTAGLAPTFWPDAIVAPVKEPS